MSENMTKEQATQKIAELIKQAHELLGQAAQLADQHQINFGYDGPAFGMGGYYSPRPVEDENWTSSDCYVGDGDDNYGWQSSNNC